MSVMSNSDEDIYMGGYRCSMCNWYDSLGEDYGRSSWIVALIHTLVHTIQAAIDFNI